MSTVSHKYFQLVSWECHRLRSPLWKNSIAGVCFCLKSNLPWLWLMSLRAEWQPAVERSTALPGLFVPRTDGKRGVTVCSTQGRGADWRTLTPTHYHQQLGSINPHIHTHSRWAELRHNTQICGCLFLQSVRIIVSVIVMLTVQTLMFSHIFKCEI